MSRNADGRLTLNTHDYDGRLTIYRQLIEQDDAELIAPDPFDKVLDEILQVLPSVNMDFYHPGHRDYIPSETLKMHVKTTVRKLQTERGSNHDGSDNINIEDLLPRVWRFVRKYEINGAAKVFYEQLAAITWSGPCPQGRAKRIMQFYTQHMQTRDEIYKKCLRRGAPAS